MTTTRPGVFTPSELHRLGRRLDRRAAAADRVLSTMKRGESLHLQFENGRPLWSLRGGRPVSAEVANLIISNANVTPVGAALFSNMLGQVWRYTDG